VHNYNQEYIMRGYIEWWHYINITLIYWSNIEWCRRVSLIRTDFWHSLLKSIISIFILTTYYYYLCPFMIVLHKKRRTIIKNKRQWRCWCAVTILCWDLVESVQDMIQYDACIICFSSMIVLLYKRLKSQI
jgi:hypothetical protein